VINPARLSGSPAIVVEDLGIVFGKEAALRGVSFDVGPGERIFIQGHNGAGKTTLIRVLAGLLKPDRGSIRVAGGQPYDLEVRRQIGVVLHNPWLDPDLTVDETLSYFAALYKLGDYKNRAHALLERLDLTDYTHRSVSALSRGYQQRLTLARALLHDPSILLLDEPETGLDESTRDSLSAMLDDQRTVVMTSHNEVFGRSIAQRVLVLDHGQLRDRAAPVPAVR
jgi:heme exporter protein A